MQYGVHTQDIVFAKVLLMLRIFSINEAGGFEQRSKAEQKKKVKYHRKKGMLSVMSVALNSCGKDGARSHFH